MDWNHATEEALEQPGVIRLDDEEIEALLEALRHIGLNDDDECPRCQSRTRVHARLESLLGVGGSV